MLSVKEALVQFDQYTQKPFVELDLGDQQFEKRDVELGISDGIMVEVLEGLTLEDKVKVWNITEPFKNEASKKENKK